VITLLGSERDRVADAFVQHRDHLAADEQMVLPVLAPRKATRVDGVDAEDRARLRPDLGMDREQLDQDRRVFQPVGAFGQALLPEGLEVGVGARRQIDGP
jgi:hypothetical protein